MFKERFFTVFYYEKSSCFFPPRINQTTVFDNHWFYVYFRAGLTLAEFFLENVLFMGVNSNIAHND